MREGLDRIAFLHPDGRGGFAHDGCTVLVEGALPGDRVRWAEDPARPGRGRTVNARVVTRVEDAPERRPPPCPHADACGGCDLSAWSPAARREALAASLARAFGWSGDVPVLTGGDAGVRARITLHVEEGLVGYRAAGSHRLVPVDRCPIARPEVEEGLTRLRAVVAAHPGIGWSRVEIRSDGARVVFAAEGRGGPPSGIAERAAPLEHLAWGGRPVLGDPSLRLPSTEGVLQAGPSSFYQVNLEANARMVDLVRARVREAGAERVLDLYAGIGNFGLPIAADGVPVVAVEREGRALADLRRSAEDWGLAHRVQAVAIPAERFDPSREPYDVAVLDPPRAGAGAVLGRVLRNRPRRAIYVSCHPRTAARDLRQHAGGYRLTGLVGVDLFPDTHHLEAVLVLDRA